MAVAVAVKSHLDARLARARLVRSIQHKQVHCVMQCALERCDGDSRAAPGFGSR